MWLPPHPAALFAMFVVFVPTLALVVSNDVWFAFAFNAVCVAELMGLFASVVLSTFDKPTSALLNAWFITDPSVWILNILPYSELA